MFKPIYQLILPQNVLIWPIPFVARFKTQACQSSFITTAGSNLAGGMGVCVLYLLCVVGLEASERDRSFVQRSPTEWVCVHVCDQV